MRLKINEFGLGIALVAIMFSFFCMFALGSEMSADVPSVATLGLWSFYLLVSMIIGFFLLIYISPRLRVFKPYKSRKYYLVPIYHSSNGPRGSDAVVCRVREVGKKGNKWGLRIVPLSAFSPEDRCSISDLFNTTTGEPIISEDPFTISAKKIYNRNLLTVVTNETIVEEEHE